MAIISEMFNRDYTYYDEYQYSCTHNCCRQLLEYFNVKHADFYINTALDLAIEEREDSLYKYRPIIDPSPFLPKYMDKFHEYIPEDQDYSEVWEINKSKIDEGIPIIVCVDVYYLRYTPVYLRDYYIHDFLLCGYSEVDKNVKVVDWYEPWFFKGKLSLEEFKQARFLDNPEMRYLNHGKSVSNSWIEVDRDGWKAEVRDLLYDTVSLSRDQYFGRNRRSGKNIQYGYDSMNLIISRLRNCIDEDPKLYKEYYKFLHRQLYLLLQRKRLFKRTLEEGYKYIPHDSIRQCIDMLNVSIEQWRKLLLFILKSSFVISKEIQLKIIDRFSSLVKKEEVLYGALDRICRSI